jgi:phosphoribosyl 1,2-cyclic phosphodiesterase
MHRKFGLPVYANRPTLAATLKKGSTGRIDRWHHFTSGHPFQIGRLWIEPLSTPHDAIDSVCFVIEETTTGKRFGLFTDLGHVFGKLRDVIGTLDAVLIESNYDDDMLWDGPYPYRLKERIAGSAGHISNREAAALLDGCDASRLQWACLGHLSGENNSPEVAMATHRHRHRDRFQLFCADRSGATLLPEIRHREVPLRSYALS